MQEKCNANSNPKTLADIMNEASRFQEHENCSHEKSILANKLCTDILLQICGFVQCLQAHAF